MNLIVGWALLRYSMNFSSSDGGPGQIQSILLLAGGIEPKP